MKANGQAIEFAPNASLDRLGRAGFSTPSKRTNDVDGYTSDEDDNDDYSSDSGEADVIDIDVETDDDGPDGYAIDQEE